MKQWKKFVGYDEKDRSQVGEDSANPGPIDNKSLLAGEGCVCIVIYVHGTVGCVGGGGGRGGAQCLFVNLHMYVLCMVYQCCRYVCLHLAVYQVPSLQFSKCQLFTNVSAFLFCVSVWG